MVAVAGVALVLCDFVKGEPVRGGYGDSLQNLGGYGGGGGGGYGGGGDSGYGHVSRGFEVEHRLTLIMFFQVLLKMNLKNK